MAKDYVRVILRRKTAEELVNALIIALGDDSWGKDKGKGKGKGKKKDGGGDKYTPAGKPGDTGGGGGKTQGGSKSATASKGGTKKPKK